MSAIRPRRTDPEGIIEEVLGEWPNCATPDCEFKSCRWAGTGLCYGCTTLAVGRAEMDRRFRLTRAPDGSWNGRLAPTQEAP